jgi:hypothetical protein
MKNDHTLARRPSAHHADGLRNKQSLKTAFRACRAARRRAPGAVRLALCLALLCQGLLLGGAAPALAQKKFSQAGVAKTAPVTPDAIPAQTDPDSPVSLKGVKDLQPISTTSVNFEAVARKAAAQSKVAGAKTKRVGVAVSQNFNMLPPGVATEEPGRDPQKAGAVHDEAIPNVQPLAASPSPSSSFQAQPDVPKTDGPQAGFSFTPPDTDGAVGIDKLMVTVNNVYTIQNKLTGAVLSSASTDAFWNAGAATPRGTGYFDPKTAYDPYNNRFIATILSNGVTANSRLHIAVSQTSDPQGNWFIATFQAGTAGTPSFGADFPTIGFNKNWITISLNIFNLTSGALTRSDIYFIDYPPARTGTFGGSIFSLGGAGTVQPAVTYSTTEENMYAPFVFTTTSMGLLKFSPDGPDANLVPDLTIVSLAIPMNSDSSAVNFNLGEVMPQAPPLVGTPRKILGNDARLTNAVFRNGSIWTAHHFGVRGPTTPFPTVRTAAQAYQLSPAAAVLQRLRVEDPTATDTNGGKWYGFASVAVNRANDVIIGYTQFASNQFPSAGYSTHLAADAANTVRDPVIYQAGLGYYDKDFTASGTDTGGNRWGDYSISAVDPVNDTDLWTIQEISNPQVGTGNPVDTNNNSGRWNTWWAKVAFPASAGDLVISEFRLRGPNGLNDEFIELYNAAPVPLTVSTLDGSGGYGVAASDGSVRCVVPNGTVIPQRGHYLCVNSVGYSLASYPAGVGTTATGDATYTTDIPDNTGIAVFNTATFANFSLATRLDAAGSTTEVNPLFKEGTGYPALSAVSIDYSFHRDQASGFPKDTGDNAADFLFVDTQGNCAYLVACTTQDGLRSGRHLGAPGPENSSSPVLRSDVIKSSVIDFAQATSSPPNRARTQRASCPSCDNSKSNAGTLEIRRTFTNNTSASVTRLRFRVVDITTFPDAVAIPGSADLRVLSSSTIPVTVTGGGTVTVQGLTLEEPPAQPGGGGFNSSLTLPLASPLAPGGSVSVNFLLGVQTAGNFRFFIIVEALP